MKGKKILSLILTSALCVGILSGCAKKVTAEDLVNNAFPKDLSSVEFNMNLNYSGEVNAEGMTMQMGMSGTLNAKETKDCSSIDGNVSVDLFGFKVETPVKTYSDYVGKCSYIYDSDSDAWTKTKSEDKSANFSTFPKASDFTDLKLVDSKNNNYVVTGKIKSGSISSIAGPTSEITYPVGADLEDMSYLMTMEFDKKTQLIKKVTLVFDESAKIEGMESVEFETSIDFVKFNDVKLSIPDDVINNAVEDDEITYDFE